VPFGLLLFLPDEAGGVFADLPFREPGDEDAAVEDRGEVDGGGGAGKPAASTPTSGETPQSAPRNGTPTDGSML
jgi:hypothetical protein